jgi:hypothetical protein
MLLHQQERRLRERRTKEDPGIEEEVLEVLKNRDLASLIKHSEGAIRTSRNKQANRSVE